MKKNLGRGLASLMGGFENVAEKEIASKTQIHDISINKIKQNRDQPRKYFDEESLQELARSIKRSGIISPIIVKRIKSTDEYEIVAGERRFRAAQYAKITAIPAIIKNIGEETAFEISIIENIQRQNLNIVEEAKSYRELMSKYSYNQNDVALIVGKSRSHITNILRLLKLPDAVLDLIISGKITMGHAKNLVGVENAEKIAEEFIKRDLTVREAEQFVRALIGKSFEGTKIKKEPNLLQNQSDIKVIENLLGKKLNTSVKIKSQSQSEGTISVKYKSLEQLDKVLQLLGSAD
ncbi:MAG: ParB/RepB/Spo0J family partition protein [Alphaproteobacteria bacterium]|nr:ParB/RepB/Spo0J family partition protein [Alphaproteobacteria bacterium]